MSDTFDFTVVLEPQPEGGFTVSVPALPEVLTERDSEAWRWRKMPFAQFWRTAVTMGLRFTVDVSRKYH